MDTLLVGSKGDMTYQDVPEDQIALVHWAMDHTVKILEAAAPGSWTSKWLNVMTDEKKKGFAPKIPVYGFGDDTSVGLVRQVTKATADSGAVRHGAECFNYFFPQEMDDEFLVVWEGLVERHGVPWKLHSEAGLRGFILDRIHDGYAMPLNPIWPIRDEGWYDIYCQLRDSEQCAAGKKTFECWYPKEVQQRIIDIYNSVSVNYFEHKAAAREAAAKAAA
jgi:hypothetical protein